MSAADKRVAELLDRWLASLELHASYLDLSNEDYARAQAWPPHQRPTRWIIDLARSRTTDLKRLLEQRHASGDAEFADALELMGFLTTLLGAEHIERFIPLATASRHAQAAPRTSQPPARPVAAAAGATAKPAQAQKPEDAPAPVIAPVIQPVTPEGEQTSAAPGANPATRQRVIPAARTSAPVRVIPAASSRSRNDTTIMRVSPAEAPGGPNSGNPRAAAARAGAARPGPGAAKPADKAVNQVIDDAVRMLEWGREWPQLAGLIARLADRPAEKEVWRILREHKSTIQARAKPPAD